MSESATAVAAPPATLAPAGQAGTPVAGVPIVRVPPAWRRRRPRVPVSPLAATAAAWLMFWHLGTPALWLDESASTVASERTWPALWRLLDGSDAPLVPYYAVLKAADAAALAVAPGLSGHLTVLVRWPSALAMVIAVGLLTGWVERASSPGVAVGAAALLLATSGMSRYGQETRPYALVLMLAVVATVLWWAAVRGQARWTHALWPLYSVAVGGMIALHALSASLVLVHLVAAPLLRAGTAGRRGRRWLRALLTLGFAGAGVALALPLTLQAARHGGGAGKFAADTLHNLLTAGGSEVYGPGRLGKGIVAGIVVLGVSGLTRWSSPRYGDLVRVSALWCLLPPVAWALAVREQPKLLIGRYVLFVLPGLAVLAAVGLLTLAALVTRWAGRVRPALDRPYLTAALMAPVLIGFAALQWPALTQVRTVAGHGENLRPVLAALDQPLYRDLPIYFSPAGESLGVQAMDPGDDQRLLTAIPQVSGPNIWPLRPARGAISAGLRPDGLVLFVVRAPQFLPAAALQYGYQVVRVLPHGYSWNLFLAERDAGSAAVPMSPATSAQGRAHRLERRLVAIRRALHYGKRRSLRNR